MLVTWLGLERWDTFKGDFLTIGTSFMQLGPRCGGVEMDLLLEVPSEPSSLSRVLGELRFTEKGVDLVEQLSLLESDELSDSDSDTELDLDGRR